MGPKTVKLNGRGRQEDGNRSAILMLSADGALMEGPLPLPPAIQQDLPFERAT